MLTKRLQLLHWGINAAYLSIKVINKKILEYWLVHTLGMDCNFFLILDVIFL